jgi:hypothetical protein
MLGRSDCICAIWPADLLHELVEALDAGEVDRPTCP